MNEIDYKALIQVKACRDRLTQQQYKTIRGQVLSGNPDGALKGLRRILKKEENHARDNENQNGKP